MACMTSGASSVTLQSLYWRSSNNFSVPAESSRVNWCSPARRLEDEILESRSHKGEVWSKWLRSAVVLISPACIGDFFRPVHGNDAGCRARASLLEARRLDDGGALLHLADDIAGELVRRAAERIEAGGAQRRPHVVGLDRLVGNARELLDHVARRAGRRQQAE